MNRADPSAMHLWESRTVGCLIEKKISCKDPAKALVCILKAGLHPVFPIYFFTVLWQKQEKVLFKKGQTHIQLWVLTRKQNEKLKHRLF